MIIELSEKEYLAELRDIYENEVKYYLMKGKSLTWCMKRLKIGTGKYNRKYQEIRQMALDDGYNFQGANHK